jgi:glycosyltransferase involved in cell wall biosynthesis
MNKALKHATGEIVGFINSDDFYANNQVLTRIAMAFQTNCTEMVYGDLVFIDSKFPDKIARYYSVPGFKPWWLKFGIMPPHTASFLKAEVFKNYGFFKTDYQIAADYEFFVRTLWKAKISYSYLPGILVKMRSGGTSSCGLKSKLTLNKEIIKGCRENGLKTNLLLLSFKIPFRIAELIRKP